MRDARPREVRPAETLGMPCAFCGRGISYVAGLGGCRRIVGRIACSDCADDYFMAVGSWGGTDEDREEAGRRWAERRGVILDPGRNQ